MPFLIAYDDMTHKSKGNYRTYNWPCPFLRTFFCKDFKCWSRSETATIVLISHFTLKLATVPTLLPKCERQTVEISLTTLAKSWLAHLSAGNRGLRVWGPAIMGFASVSCIAENSRVLLVYAKNLTETCEPAFNCRNWRKLRERNFGFHFRFRLVACKIMTNCRLNCVFSTCLWTALGHL